MPRQRLNTWTLVSVLALSLTLSVAAQDDTMATASFDRDRLPAAGREAAILTVPSFGRYSISADSTQGSAIQLVDRMAGPGPIVGEAAEKDGRLDVFLDRGEYKIWTYGHPQASGEVELSVHPFREQSPEPVQLIELRDISGRLGDYEQISYWLHIEKRRRVSFEAAGRHLQDLRLWHGGAWLIDAAPTRKVIEPRVGQPLQLCQLTAELNPGLYRLSAYGGVSQPWAEDSGERPFHLRFGIRKVGESSRQRLEVSPFGFDRFLVPGDADYFRLELPEARPATLSSGWFQPENPWANDSGSDSVFVVKESLPPVAELSQSRDSTRMKMVTVSAEAGQPYVLQHFVARRSYRFERGGTYWVSTIHSGHPEDSIDATALLVRHRTSRGPMQPLRSQVIEVGEGKTWARRANLLAPLTLHLRITKTGSYEVLGSGTDARFRIEPFLITRPRNYESPPFREPGSVWDLDAGFYVLTVEPVKKGIIEVAIRPRGWFDSVKEIVGLNKDPSVEVPHGSVRFGPVSFDDNSVYTMYLNRQPEVTAGFVVRPVPLELTGDPLSLTQRPGEIVEVAVRSRGTSLLQALAEDGSRLEIAVDGGAWGPEAWLDEHVYRVRIRHQGPGNAVYNLTLRPRRLLAETSLPPVPEEILARLPDFPILTDQGPRFFDLDRGAATTFLVAADEPALYRLETAGLLATEGNLRTRVVTSLARQSTNGIGRNFLVQQYLREGDYQISVAAQGRSAGHLGLQLQRTAIHEGGLLSDGVPARAFLPAGEAIAYRLKVEEAGSYRLRSIGVGRTFRARLEDDDGWPLMSPAVEADFTRSLEPGEYRLIVLPETVSARQLTLLERVRGGLHYTGHGPHDLPIGPWRLRHRWQEDEGRPADVFRFHLPARADVMIFLNEEMHGDVFRVDVGPEKVAYVPPKRNFEGRLAAGEYELRVRSLRVNNHVDYQVGIESRQLLAGQSRQVQVPSTVPVAVGAGLRLSEVTSFGSADVRARLVDSEGRVVAFSDDRPGDWNFLLTERLPAGDYQLRLHPVGTGRTTTEVTLKHPEEREGKGLRVPGTEELDPGRAVTTYPLDLPADAEGLVLAATSAESVGISLERADGEAWATIATRVGREVRIEMPLRREIPFSDRYRLRVWSLDQRGNPIRLQTAAGALAQISEGDLAKGVDLRSFVDSPVAFVAVDLERPGCFALTSEDAVRFADAEDKVASAVDGPVPASGERLFLTVALSGSRRLQARRLVLRPGSEPVLVQLPTGGEARCDVEAGEGALIVATRAVVGDPGVAVSTAGEPGTTRPAVASHAALTVSLVGEQPVAAAWSGDGLTALELRLQAWRFPLPSSMERATWGLLDGEVEATARVFELPAGEKRLRLVLAPSVVMAVAEGDQVTSVHWADRETREEVLETSASRLVFFRLGDSGGFRVEVLPIDERLRLRSLSLGHPFEGRLARAGILRLPVAATDRDDVRLRVWGAEEATLLGAEGSIVRGVDLAAPRSGGILLLRHRPSGQGDSSQEPGVVLAWLERPGQGSDDAWGDADADAKSVELPAVVELDGVLQAFELAGEAARVLHLRSATPLVVRLETATGEARVEVHPSSAALDAFVPAGTARLLVRALGGGRLDGTVELASSPVIEVGEGLGPEILLGAGETRLFSFHVTQGGSVGLGVRADADVVETVLLDANGQALGRGVVQMHHLEPGDYLLQVHSPAGAPPLGARAIVIGLERPATTPPEEVVREYLRMARRDAEEG